ncbi:glycosyltransferase [Flavobacterium sp. F-65]|uniref:Glycosyltransferase n=1 Tax=Flavobacterium pisciphilum TaxID=2893755 RepID=A0ABS8MSH3_9FLAO|nr:glycosyltransferase [Flavobacterium sp. F-65]MCC9071720.1 glycosyltransferase [Flavobacterium sp. F-65]
MLKEDNYLFSIIIPTYNRRIDLERCLNSLVEQTFKNFEVVICDNASTDQTIELVEKYTNLLNLNYIRLPENSGGPARPRNTGISQAKGEWICFLDSDDWYTADKLAYISNLSLDNIDFVYHRLLSVDKSGSQGEMFTRQINNKTPVIDLLTRFNPILTSSTCIRKSVFSKNNLSFSEEKKIIGVEDFDLWIRMGIIGAKFKLINKNLGFYNKEGADSLSYVDERQVARLNEVYSAYRHLLSLRQQKKSLAAFSYQKGFLLLGDNDKRISFENFVIALKYGVIYIKIRALIRIVSLTLNRVTKS